MKLLACSTRNDVNIAQRYNRDRGTAGTAKGKRARLNGLNKCARAVNNVFVFRNQTRQRFEDRPALRRSNMVLSKHYFPTCHGILPESKQTGNVAFQTMTQTSVNPSGENPVSNFTDSFGNSIVPSNNGLSPKNEIGPFAPTCLKQFPFYLAKLGFPY